MLRVLRSEVFITLMAAAFLACLVEVFLDRNFSNVVCFGLLFSSLGLMLGLTAAANTPARRKR